MNLISSLSSQQFFFNVILTLSKIVWFSVLHQLFFSLSYRLVSKLTVLFLPLVRRNVGYFIGSDF